MENLPSPSTAPTEPEPPLTPDIEDGDDLLEDPSPIEQLYREGIRAHNEDQGTNTKESRDAFADRMKKRGVY